jgi:hypothetical protein
VVAGPAAGTWNADALWITGAGAPVANKIAWVTRTARIPAEVPLLAGSRAAAAIGLEGVAAGSGAAAAIGLEGVTAVLTAPLSGPGALEPLAVNDGVAPATERL